MVPLTRMRSDPGDIPNAPRREYHKPARASGGGLIVWEAAPVLRQGYGYADAPGIYDDIQIAG
jgi:N-ethylmaleimide reductase